MNGENSLNLPQGVVDEKAYRKYVDICNNEIFADHNRYFVSQVDESLIVDLQTPWRHIGEKIVDLPQHEQDAIRIKHKEMCSWRTKRTKAMDKAFGRKKANERSDYILSPKTGELIELFGKYHTVQEVHRIVVEKWHYPVSLDTVRRFRVKFMDKIRERQEKFRNDFSDVRLAHKKPRLLELSQLYTHRKSIYDRTQNKEDYKLLLATLRQLNQEVEGDRITIDGNIQVDVQHTVNLQMQKEILKKTNILDLVISRIAARANINPLYILTQLHQSLYSKYTGFGGEFEPANEKDGMAYPSMLVYDFDKIQIAAQEKKQEIQQLQQFNPIDEDVERRGDDLKIKMRERLRRRQEQLNQNRDNVDNID